MPTSAEATNMAVDLNLKVLLTSIMSVFLT